MKSTSPVFSRVVRLVGSFIAIGGLTLTASCSLIEGSSTPSLPEDQAAVISWTETPAGEPLWNTEVQTAGSGPVIVDDTVVSYIAVDGALQLAGYDLSSGEQKWAYPAMTGTVDPGWIVEPEIFIGEDGSPLVSNIYSSELTQGDSGAFWLQGLQVIEVDSGDVRLTGEPHFTLGSSSDACISPTVACYVSLSLNERAFASISFGEERGWWGNMFVNHLPGFTEVSQANYGVVLGITSDDIPAVAYVVDGEMKWSTPLPQLDVEDVRLDENGSNGIRFNWVRLFDSNVLLTQFNPASTFADTNLEESSSTVYAIDLDTGENLWSRDGVALLTGSNVLYDGVLHATLNPDDSISYKLSESAQAVVVDPRTGEEIQSHPVEGVEIASPGSVSEMGIDDLLLQGTETGGFIINGSDGSLTEATEEQVFACTAQGTPFQQQSNSRGDRDVVDYTGNFIARACGVNVDSTNPADFSQAVVAFNSSSPFGVLDSEWDRTAEQVRVVATENGLTAYRF